MSDYLSYLKQLDVWLPPTLPSIDDPVWAKEFGSSTETQRVNVANAWIWALNKNYKEYGGGISGFALTHRKMIQKTSKYVTRSLFVDAVFDGTLRNVLKERSLRTGVDTTSPFLTALGNYWLSDAGSKTERAAQMHALIGLAPTNRGFEQREHMTTLQVLVWDSLQTPAFKKDPACIEAGLRLSIECGFDYVALEETRVKNYQSEAWYKLGMYATQHAKLDAKNDVFTRSIKHIHATPVKMAVKLLRLVMTRALERQFQQSELGFQPGTLFNRSNTFSTDWYTPLCTWIPQLSGLWITSQTLGLTWQEAIEAALNLPENALETSIYPENIADFDA